MRTVVVLAAVAAVLLGACSPGAVEVGGSSDPTSGVVAERTPKPAATPTPSVVAPLTGLETTDTGVLSRPVVAVKVDNHPAARPQTALADADVVVEEIVEGGVTRFIALYHSTLPPAVGPVRSGREVDADLLPAFSPVVGLSGAAPVVWGLLRGAGLTVYEEGQVGDAFWRAEDRPRPHNLFASPSALAAAGADLPPASQPWPIEADVPPGGQPSQRSHVALTPSASATWTWDDQQRRWLRSEDGAPHLDAVQRRQTAENVVFAEVDVRAGGRTDAGGNRTVDTDVIGEGPATVLRDGRAYRARWRKSGPDSQLEWWTPDGSRLPLAPGRTWIELVPTSGTVTLS